MASQVLPKVLIVDDNENNIYTLEKILENCSVDTDSALSGEEALIKMLDDTYDLLLLDIQMPEMDGFEVAELLYSNDQTSQIPIIFMSAISKEEKYLQKGYELGAVDYLFKPINKQELYNKINAFTKGFQNKSRLDILEKEHKQTEELKKILHHKISHDALTGLYNRFYFEEKFNHALSMAKHSSQKMALLLVNIDGFKKFNETYGFNTGDFILKEVGYLLKTAVSEHDCVARIGADEFTIYLQNIKSAEHAAKIAESIMDSLSNPIVDASNHEEYYINVSIGIALYPLDGSILNVLFKETSAAVNKAKKLGKNNYQFVNKDMQEDTINSVQLFNNLSKAVINNEFTLHFQPIVDVEQNNLIYGVESLVRWQPDGSHFISPGIFIPIAEENGLINWIGNFVLEQSCAQYKEWALKGIAPNYVSINVSTYQLLSPDFISSIKRVINKYDVSPCNIQLEITENILVNSDDILSLLVELKEIGFLLAIDDYGTGYSCLSYLHKMPIDTLKIDREFIIHINNEKDRAILKSIIDLADNLKLRLVAEGVETVEQLNLLNTHGSPLIQGYLFAKPVSNQMLVEKYFSNNLHICH